MKNDLEKAFTAVLIPLISWGFAFLTHSICEMYTNVY
jgi:hypothetical protein